ncbi:hypothetical protein VN97_g12336, partial [Penicillium thymicola]
MNAGAAVWIVPAGNPACKHRLKGVSVDREREERRREREKLFTTCIDVDLSHVGPRPQAPRHPTNVLPHSYHSVGIIAHDLVCQDCHMSTT